MTLKEFLAKVTGYTQSQKDEYQKLQESSGLESDMTTDLSFNDWHDDMSLAATMGMLEDDPNG